MTAKATYLQSLKNKLYIAFSEADGYNFDDYDSHFQN